MANPLVSVVLPVYNGAKFVQDAIHSIRQQSFPDWELIILDDGSSDDSLKVCQKCALEDNRIRIYSHEVNLGLARTMNELVKLAKSTYIAVQEQDDISMPDRLAKELALFKSDPEIGLVSGVAAWINDESKIFNYFPGKLHKGIFYPTSRNDMVAYLFTEQCKVVNAACMFRKNILDEVDGPFDENAKLSIDWQFFIHVAHLTKIAGIPDVLVKMRRGQTHNHLTNKKELQFKEARRCITLIYNKYDADIISPINKRLYCQAMVTELVLEGRYWGGFRGLAKLLMALSYDPSNLRTWNSIWESFCRFIKIK